VFGKNIVVVSRHKGTIDYLKSKLGDVQVIEHLTSVEQIPKNSVVIGNLPINMIEEVIKRGNEFILVTLDIPKELRGKDLDVNEVKKYVKFYKVKKLELEEVVI